MFRIVTLLVLAAPLVAPSAATASFADHFEDRTLRIDYHHSGDANTEVVAIDRVYRYGSWAGSLNNLIDTLNYGAYYHKVYDADTERLLYSRGFDSYFKEYQTSTPALSGVVKTFHESAIVPLPKHKVIFSLEKRSPDGGLREVFRTVVDPNDVMVVHDERPDPEVVVVRSLHNGDPHQHADVAIIAEGYTKEERAKFEADLQRFTDVFFLHEPTKSYKSRFNVYGVFKPSLESGCDEPRAGVFRRTSVETTFNSMGSERYILTENNRALRDIARHVPYDALYIMINHDRYGGGGIYNFYCTFTSDNQWSEFLMVHEFGHSFFGLADEYYSSSTAYNDFYPAGREPSEPNITAFLDPSRLKWAHLIKSKTPLPTPWEKSGYDEISAEWGKVRVELNDKMAAMRRDGADENAVKQARAEYDKIEREYAERAHEYLANSKFAGRVGVFEGAGYASAGLYRSMADCIMFTKAAEEFCVACHAAMVGIIDWYSH